VLDNQRLAARPPRAFCNPLIINNLRHFDVVFIQILCQLFVSALYTMTYDFLLPELNNMFNVVWCPYYALFGFVSFFELICIKKESAGIV